MLHAFKRAVLAVALLATTVGAAATAEARDRYGRRGGGDDAAIAIGAGVVGLAIGAALASDNRRGYYRDRYYYPRSRYRTSYYYQSYPGYYYDGYPRYYRSYPRYRGDRYRSRHHNRYYGSRYYSGRHYNGYSRYDGRRDRRYRYGW